LENKLKKSKIVISCDKWLSKILNKKTFRINLLASNLKSNDLEAAIIKRKNYYKDQKIFFYSKVLMHNISHNKVCIKNNFRLINKDLIFKKSNKFYKKNISVKNIRIFKRDDKKFLLNIAKNNFVYSRFHQDINISKYSANYVKECWLNNFFLGRRGNDLIVATYNDKPIGFLLLLKVKKNIVIDLIAVNKKYSGKGYATSMIKYLERNYSYNNILVGTQMNNIASKKLYKKLNYQIYATLNIFHLHI